MKIPNIDIYTHTEKVYYEAMESEYNSHRRGLYDFPSKEKWLKEMWKRFRRNNPELCGLVWDNENQYWIHKYEGRLIRIIL